MCFLQPDTGQLNRTQITSSIVVNYCEQLKLRGRLHHYYEMEVQQEETQGKPKIKIEPNVEEFLSNFEFEDNTG